MQLTVEKALFLCTSQRFSEKKQKFLSGCEFSQRLVRNIQSLCASKCRNTILNGHFLLGSRLTKLYSTTISTSILYMCIHVCAMTHFFKNYGSTLTSFHTCSGKGGIAQW